MGVGVEAEEDLCRFGGFGAGLVLLEAHLAFAVTVHAVGIKDK